MSGPLSGLRVIEVGTLIAAPFAARLFGEFGANVIKVEMPDGGDPLRRWRKMYNGTSLWWYLQSRNKKSIGIDLKTPEGVDIVKRLVASADVMIENYRPDWLEKLGLGWDVLSETNPNLVLVRISGFGQTGPYRDRPGFGAVAEALGGIRYTTGEPGMPPARVGVSLGDSLASLHGVIGALMALLNIRSGRGKGQVVDVSLVESVFNVMESLVPEYDLMGVVRERAGGALPGISPSNTYTTADGGYIVIAGNSNPIFQRLMTVIGRQDLADDPGLKNNDDRVKRSAELDGLIGDWAREHTAAEAIAILGEADVPAGPIYSVADIMADPHYQARGMLEPMTLPDGVSVRMPGIVPKLSETPGEVRWPGPKLGEHTEEILIEAGFSAAEIASLRKQGAVC